MGITLFRTKHRVTVRYKSGQEHSFWCYRFSIQGGRYEWDACSQTNKPILMGVDHIESVWQTGEYINWWTALTDFVGSIFRSY